MKNPNSFEKIEITNVENLKQPTIYFFMKNNGFSEHYIKNLRSGSGTILLNNEIVTIRAKIKNGDVLEIAKNPNKPTAFAPCEMKLDILFEDEDYLIVNKPHNLTCNPTRSHYANNLGSQVCTYMQAKNSNFVLRILNRLDRETAGIIVIAKNVRAYNEMTDFEKEYHAICHGKIEEDFTIDKPILTVTHDGINEIKRIISPEGKRAVTHVKVLQPLVRPSANAKHFSHADSCLTEVGGVAPATEDCLVKLRLETGRTHQIRVHLSSVGHPLVGDTLYGKEADNNLSTCHLERSREIQQAQRSANPPHAMLLLKKISFTHFRTKQKIILEVPYPKEWTALLLK